MNPALEIANVSQSKYYKRIVYDACGEAITEAIRVDVSDAVPFV